MRLRPFFYYYGGKYRATKNLFYPAPKFDTIIEPFAGAAGYSTNHHERKVILCEIDPKIAALWRYLINVSSQEILGLQLDANCADDLRCCEEAKYLIGFYWNHATTQPMMRPTSWFKSGKRPKSYWGKEVRERIATQVTQIRHWKIIEGSYESLLNLQATWFIDPPYQASHGRYYKFSNVDYNHLSAWCTSRNGQVIVCESSGANWLPFERAGQLRTNSGPRGKTHSEEMVWCNETTYRQQNNVALSKWAKLL